MVLVKINQLGIIREVGSLVCLLARSRPMLTKYSKLFLLQFLKISFQNSSRPEGISWALEKIRFLTSWLSQVLTSFETPGTPLRNIRKMRLLSEKCWLKLIFKSLESLIHVNALKNLKTNFHQLFSKLINDPVTDQSFHLADRGALLWSPTSSSPIFLRKTCGFQKYKVKDYANANQRLLLHCMTQFSRGRQLIRKLAGFESKFLVTQLSFLIVTHSSVGLLFNLRILGVYACFSRPH